MDISIKRILLPCTNGVQFLEIYFRFLKDTLGSTKDTRTHWVSSNQKERTLKKGEVCSKTNKGEQEGKGKGDQNVGVLRERTF